jgi:hypothetical protein
MNSSVLTTFIWAMLSAAIAADLLWWLVVPVAVEAWKEYLDGPDYMDVIAERRLLFRGIKSLFEPALPCDIPERPRDPTRLRGSILRAYFGGSYRIHYRDGHVGRPTWSVRGGAAAPRPRSLLHVQIGGPSAFAYGVIGTGPACRSRDALQSHRRDDLALHLRR